MSRGISGVIAVLGLLAGCRDIGSVSPSSKSEGDPPIKDAFVVDFFSVQCTLKVNPGTQTLKAYFPMTLRYQFKGHPGSVHDVTFVPVGFTATHLSIFTVRPDSVDRIHDMTTGFWSDSSVASLDSVVVHFSASGAYWDFVDKRPQVFGTFGWAVDQKVKVRRR